jgi:hypothetical protein
MMGHRQVEQAALFYEFSLEKHVPADHLLRSIDRFVDVGEVRQELAPFYSSIGRPSIDPELMIRMLIEARPRLRRSGRLSLIRLRLEILPDFFQRNPPKADSSAMKQHHRSDICALLSTG